MSDDVKCAMCSKWSPKRCSEAWARMGYGACDLHEPWICYYGDKLRDCASHAQADEPTVAARLEFLARIK